MNNEAKDKLSTRILFGFFGLVIIAFVLFHTFSSLFYPYVTQEAVMTTVNKAVSAKCFVFRKENIINSNNSGFRVNSVENGSKVAKDSVVVKIFNNEKDVARSNEIDNLKGFISELEEINHQNDIYSGDLDSISSQIDNNIFNMLLSINSERFSDTKNYSDKVKYYLLQSQLATGRENNYNAVIKEYKKKLNSLQKGFSPSVTEVETDSSGYYVSGVDGYESIVDYDNIDELSVSEIDSLKAKKTAKNAIGKTISENEWYIVANVNTSDVKLLDIGDKIKIHTSIASAAELTVTIKAINKENDSGKCALIMSCMKMNKELSSLRKKNMQIVLGSYSGLRVNSKALRVVNGKKGVYVRLGQTIKFKAVNVIYSSDEYVIVDSNNSGDNLKVYDDVIIKGKNLNG